MKILLYVLLAFGVFCFFSCKRIEKEQLTFLMKEWTRKEILFHDRAVLCWETNIHHSLDSRHWGLVPDDFIVGVVQWIWYSKDEEQNSIRWNRIGRVD